ncbi:flagellar hook-length control protein FliK [Geomonas anaerohicana]|uniref:Flagellar hook-length control protein FliK n=1 Tax=Geomonas anaerohicana TaxID=2798583 RepID=A0ABS0YCF6_9BACT|nr:flagellar hook-length control protein FliK [Geomonas anaerohicana]MBJ6750003.1 flagellar hook-length control protein FliK [Geomonas anaerohicana]
MLINDEAQKQVLTILAKTAVTPTADVQERASSLLQLNPGQAVKAEIIANLPNSMYMARVAGELYKLEIPLNVQPGETLELTFVTADPRVTFQMLRPQTESVQLSSMGKWLADVVENAPGLPPATEPLVEHPEQAAAQLAGRLKTSLTQNGMFYESHLAQWALGGLPLKELLKEPQGKLSRLLAEGEGREAGDDSGGAIADSRTLPLIKEQLHLLNTGVLAWQGEAWPGQEMRLVVGEGSAEQWEQGLEANLSLELPRLGGVKARLRFTPEGINVELVCDRPGASEVMRQASGELRAALATQGLHLNKMAAKDD